MRSMPRPGERTGSEGGGHELRDRDQDDRAQHRAPQAAQAAHHRGHHGQDVPVHLEHLVREHREGPEAVEGAAGREDDGHEAAGDDLVEAAVDADGLRPVLVVAHRAEVEAPLRALDRPGREQGDREERQRQVVEAEPLAAPGELHREHAVHEAAARRDRDEEALAAVDERPGGADGLGDHPHRHGGDREVVATQLGDRVGDRSADGRRDDHRPQEGQPRVPAEIDGEQRGGVGADGEEDAGTEVELAGPPPDDVPADAEHRVEQHQEAHRLVVDLAAPLERDRVEQGHEGAEHPGDLLPATGAGRGARSGQTAPGAGTGRSGCRRRRRTRP